MHFEALILDFDGVLLESEYAGNKQIADYLTAIGHPTTPEQSMANFMGLADAPFRQAIERWIGRPLPEDFQSVREAEDRRVLEDGLPAVAGAIAFVERLPDALPRAIASSSSTEWIRAHLRHLGIERHFPLLFSGREHVARGKPAPDLYLRAAEAMGVDIACTLIVEDSPVGAEGALASGATVIGLCAGSHCAPDHGQRLRALGVERIAHGFDEIAEALGL